MVLASCRDPLCWVGCYKGNYDLITAESYAHPAKMAVGLCYRIFEHLKELGLLGPGSVVLDPMAGTGMTGLVAGMLGYRAILVELEPKFIGFIQGNKEALEKKLGRVADIEIIQGDARNLSGLLAKRGLVAVSSPPYSDSNLGARSEDFGKRLEGFAKAGSKWWRPRPTGNLAQEDYGDTPGQIGQLPDKPVAITSPPYAGAIQPVSQSAEEIIAKIPSLKGRNPKGRWFQALEHAYGNNPSNIANLPDRPVAITSPPYGDQDASGAGVAGPTSGAWKSRGAKGKPWKEYSTTPQGYGESEGQIGRMSDRSLTAITSPPYEDSNDRFQITEKFLSQAQKRWPSHNLTNKCFKGEKYGQSEGQIGQDKGETYLSAMCQVYAECLAVADVLVVVVKNPTRNGKLRRLDLDTIALLEATGWRINCVHQAMLFEETEQGHLFDGSQKRVKGRLSFFKRLAWQKGIIVADHEDCIVAVKK